MLPQACDCIRVCVPAPTPLFEASWQFLGYSQLRS
jgi:hypothetical protein